ncbi:hypothetical protein GRS48_11340 [Halorubrum sp. JWXQ-INN 858]|uniref:hypothetical protein n=1 Tax=Halorubrum sp. JWXQ-INN 858 TaxID=2690782 RepID=UPI001358B37A|nr:hypothetical protein [Halorubrum sp. JWXQ-INN 858]MWV65405.1 hypothetical protein [Halorubrum sp. JWXQ-INN 858]
MSFGEWERLPPDPDPVADLGYSPGKWTVRETNRGGRRHVVFACDDEAERDRESFIIATGAAVEDLVDRR